MEFEDLPFKVVMPSGSDQEVVGRAMNIRLARGLFQAAIAEYPTRLIELRDGARVVERHVPQRS